MDLSQKWKGLLDQQLGDVPSAEPPVASPQPTPRVGGSPATLTPFERSKTYESVRLKKLSYTHDGMINLILAHRGISQNEIAAHYGYTASWVSTIMTSDAFQARLAERAAEIEDPMLRITAEESFKGLVSRSMEILREKLEGPSASIPDNLVLRTLELSSRALGYGAREQTVAVQVNVDNHLEALGGRLEKLLIQKQTQAGPRATEPNPFEESPLASS